jgi:hypothetical protein
MSKLYFASAIALAFSINFAFGAQVLTNPGFETGALTPWAQDRDFGGAENWNVTNSDSHSGTFSATDVGNKELKQTFVGVAVSSITQVAFWAKHPDAAVTALAYDFFYSDATNTEFQVNTSGTAWLFFDVTASLTAGKTLTGFSVFGNSAGRTFVDDLSIQTGTSAVPEPGSLFLVAAAGAVLVGLRRRFV